MTVQETPRIEVRHIRTDSFSVWVDACALRGGEIWLLSMLGNQQTVKAIWAQLVKGENAYLAHQEHGPADTCWLAKEAWGTWRFFRSRLPSGSAVHGILVPDAASFTSEKRDFLLLPRLREEAPSLHYRYLNRRLDIPLHASWAKWLWKRGLDNEEIEPLEGFGVSAYHCRPNPSRMQADITTDLRRGLLSIVA